MLPTITLVTPSLNQAAFLEECLDSVLSQGYPRLEYMVLDGGSTDGSATIIENHADQLSFWRSAPDGGQYAALDEGLRSGRGEIMGWLNADDKLHPGALWKVAYAMAESPEIEWCMGRPTAWREDGSLDFVFGTLPRFDRAGYLTRWPKAAYIQQESVFWRRSLWNRAGARLGTDLVYAGDFELWVRFFRHARLYVLDALLGGYRFHSRQKVGAPDKGGSTDGPLRYMAEARAVAEAELAADPSAADPGAAPAPEPVLLDREAMAAWLVRAGRGPEDVRVASGESAAVLTSLAPGRFEAQLSAVASWTRLGLEVVSINFPDEIEALRPRFPSVAFEVARTAPWSGDGRRLVTLDDLLAAALARRDAVVGLVNADIVLEAGPNGPDPARAWLRRAARGAMVVGRRIDVAALDRPEGEAFNLGFDVFFLDRRAALACPPSGLRLGAPWWDYFLPLAAHLSGVRLTDLAGSGVKALHVRHATRWPLGEWIDYGEMFVAAVAEILARPSVSPLAEAARRRFAPGFRAAAAPRAGDALAGGADGPAFSDPLARGPDTAARGRRLRRVGAFALEALSGREAARPDPDWPGA